MKIEAILDYIIVEQIDVPKPKVETILTVPSEVSAAYGYVVAAGKGRNDLMKFTENSIKAGDTVIFSKQMAQALFFEGKMYFVLRESQIIGTLINEEDDMTNINSTISVGGLIYQVPEHVANNVMRMLSPYKPTAKPEDISEEASEDDAPTDIEPEEPLTQPISDDGPIVDETDDTKTIPE